MSSMRNAVQRRNHKERAQPLERQKWGILEKAKDYKLRAADHKDKKKRLKVLKEKAAKRNPDEFSFKMMSSTVDNKGRKVTDRGNKALSMDVVKLLKTQDAGYIRTMLQMVRKEREDLEQQIVVEDEEVRALKDGEDGRRAKHTAYVDDEDEQEEFDPDSWFGKGGELPGRAHPRDELDGDEDEAELNKRRRKRTKKQLEAELLAEKEKKALLKKRERSQQRSAAHLEALKAKERDLMAVEEELEKQRAKMNNSVGGVNKHGVKFKIRERKR